MVPAFLFFQIWYKNVNLFRVKNKRRRPTKRWDSANKKMKKALLTGGTGFIGYHIIRRLCHENVAVRCLVRHTSSRSGLQAFDVEYCVGELHDPESLRRAVEGCDTVFHLAGLVRARNYREFENVNRFGTENLARASAGCSPPPVFVYVSSLAAAGTSMPHQPRKETDPAMPISKYGKSKLAGEAALMQFAGQMPCTIVRPCIVFGEADRMNLEIFRFVKKWGMCPIPGYGDKCYSWIHADDLSDLLITAARKGERLGQNPLLGTGIYLASSDTGRKMSEIGHIIAGSLGKDRVCTVHCTPIPLWAISTFYEVKKWCTGHMQPFDWEKAWEALHHWTCSPEKAQSQLNFSPQPLEKRIYQTTQWFSENGWL